MTGCSATVCKSSSRYSKMLYLTTTKLPCLLITKRFTGGSISREMSMKHFLIKTRLKVEMHILNEQRASNRTTTNIWSAEAFQLSHSTTTHCSVKSQSRNHRRSNKKKGPKSWLTLARRGTLHCRCQIKSSLKDQVSLLIINLLITTLAIRLSRSPCLTMTWPSRVVS